MSLARRPGEERFDDLFQIRALAFRAVQFLRVVLLEGQHFAKFLVAFAAEVFVERHRFRGLLMVCSVEGTRPLHAPRASLALPKVHRPLPCGIARPP